MTYLANIAHIDPLAFPQRQSRLHEHFGVRRRPGGLQRRAGANSVALGWNRMSDEQVLKQLTIKQGVRFFTYRWEDSPPIPPEEIIRSASNMHLIPANAQIERQLFAVQKGSRVRLRGQLVDVRGPNGFTWNSSRTRDDTGNGACELVFVTGVEVVR